MSSSKNLFIWSGVIPLAISCGSIGSDGFGKLSCFSTETPLCCDVNEFVIIRLF
jgi:hypothetical protein